MSKKHCFLSDNDYRVIAQKSGSSVEEVKKVIEGQFKFVAFKIKSPDFRSIRIKHIGVIEVSPRKIHMLTTAIERAKQRERIELLSKEDKSSVTLNKLALELEEQEKQDYKLNNKEELEDNDFNTEESEN